MATKKKETTETEVKPKATETTKLAVVNAAPAPALVAEHNEPAWGHEAIESKDLLIPKLLLMQGLSKLVADGVAMTGQIRESLGGNLIGGKEKPVEFVAFTSNRTWVCFEKDASDPEAKDEYTGTAPITPENEGLALTEEVGGMIIRRDISLNFYVLLVSEIEEGTAFPYVVSFRRTSMTAGKKLSTYGQKLRAFKRSMASKVFALKSISIENDKGKFAGFDIEQGRDSTKKEEVAAKEWYDAFKKQGASVKVDDSDLRTEPASVRETHNQPQTTEY